jgi:rhomboid protease GluP
MLPTTRPLPAATIGVFAITSALTLLALAVPPVLSVLQRTPDALAKHETWRLVTAFFVNRGGVPEIPANLALLALLGAFVEHRFGARWWLAVFVASGIVGELAGCAWKPWGAGSSVGFAGLLGAAAAWLVLEKRTMPAIFAGSCVALGALVLSASKDLHGPAIVVGIAVGATALLRKARRASPS